MEALKSGSTGSRPKGDLIRVADSHRRFVDAVENSVNDASIAQPSALPDWTVGHVISHVARNADSHRRRVEAALRNEVVEQYAGGYSGRAAEILLGATRPAIEMIKDLRTACDRLIDAWDSLPMDAWDMMTRDVSGTERPLFTLPARRWQEVEVHLVDLGVGITPSDWSSAFVNLNLPRLRMSLARRLPAGSESPSPDRFQDGKEELAWLYGRIKRPDLPVLAPWG
jgi:maleylpyruvate isomerase